MADTLFIKAAAFCGYDKTDVDKRLDTLYTLIYNLKNEIRENKQIIKKYEEGCNQDKAYENAIAVERAQLTQLQVKNENLIEKNKSRQEELKTKEQENAKLNEEIAALKEEVEVLRLEQLALKNNNTEDLGIIFIEAKKSRDLIVNKAKEEANEVMEEARKFSEELIAETNEKIRKLIDNAEKKASDTLKDAEAKRKALVDEEVSLKNAFLEKIKSFGDELNSIKASVDAFTAASDAFFDDSKKLLSETEAKASGLAKSDDSVKKPEPPQTNADNGDNASPAVETDKKSVADTKPEENNGDNADNQNSNNESGINLDDLLKQAEELNNI